MNGNGAGRKGTARERSTPKDPRRAAFERRLADGPGRRWAWAIAAGVPFLGLVPLVVHGASRRTATPALYGVAALAAAGFAMGTYAGVVTAPQRPGEPARGPGGALAALAVGVGMAVFAWGHRQGQERAAVEARRWLELDL